MEQDAWEATSQTSSEEDLTMREAQALECDDPRRALRAGGSEMERPATRQRATSHDAVHPLQSARLTSASAPDFWPAWDRELAMQGRSLRPGHGQPAAEEATQGEDEAASAEREFQSRIRVQKYVKYFDRSVLNYSTEGIVGPGVFWSIFTAASVFGSWRMIRDLLIIIMFSVLVTLTILVSHAEITEQDSEKLKSLVTDFHTLCTFLLGFFCSTSITRWWAMRNDCLGGLWGSIDDLSLLVGSYFNTASAADQEVRQRVLRWSVLSHELLYKQARAETDLSDLVQRGLLLPEELELLRPLASKPQVIWAWMCSYFAHLAYGDPSAGGSRLPFPVTVLPQLHEICRHARGAVGMAFAYTDTQIPFRYVHFLSLIIWMHNFAQAVNSGAVFAVAYREKAPITIVVEAAFLFLYPLVYFGLLHLGAGMLNPLRAHKDVDFPQGAFTYYMLAENRAFYEGNTQPKGPPYGKPPAWAAQGAKPGQL